MANTRQSVKELSQVTRETARKAAEQTEQVVRTAADVGAKASWAGVHLLQRNTETLQQAWESGTTLATQLTERSWKWFARPFGIPGQEAQQSAEQSARALESIAQSGTILTSGMQIISQEMLGFAQRNIEQNLNRVDALANCRTPFEIIAVQTEFFRDNLEHFAQSARRIGEASVHIADEVARKMSDVSLAPP
jgi:hypothetical protein